MLNILMVALLVGAVEPDAAAPPAAASQAAEPPAAEPQAGEQSQEKKNYRMSLDELLDLQIVSVSNRREKINTAPAPVIVLTAEDITQRGYTELSQILDDLPGMDIARGYGDPYVKNYWHGYRNTIGEAYIFMVDSVIFNDLWRNETTFMTAIPLSNIDHIEIVYGPVSSVYGANAFRGVINIITKADQATDGLSFQSKVGMGFYGQNVSLFDNYTKVVDASVFYKKSDLRLSLATRFETGVLDTAKADRYEYTNHKYSQMSSLWGGFANNQIFGGYDSPHQMLGVDGRASYGNFQIGAQLYNLISGEGLVFPYDKSINTVRWSMGQRALTATYHKDLGEHLTWQTAVWYRESYIEPNSSFLESYNVTANDPNTGLPDTHLVLDWSYWGVYSKSWWAFNDVEFHIVDNLALKAGIRLIRKDLQKAYDNPYGPSIPPSQADPSTYKFPAVPTGQPDYTNRFLSDDAAAYLQAAYTLEHNVGDTALTHIFNLGLRVDNNSIYGSAPTLRAGYVFALERLTAKLLYGQAFMEPQGRLLYGGWAGSGSRPTLVPERTQTFDASVGYATSLFNVQLSGYYAQDRDIAVTTSTGAENSGTRNVYGINASGQAIFNPEPLAQLRLWAYYSFIQGTELTANAAGNLADQDIGDLATHKFLFGITPMLNDNFSATLLARVIGSRETVFTNPIRNIGSFAVVDLNVLARSLFYDGVGLDLRITNLFNTTYAHPGVREANAGATPGAFSGAGVWQGSGGWYTSELVQPGRQIMLLLRMES